MSFDGSRFTFDSWNNFLGVVMQQGRVQLDSDWNEWLAEFARRIQAGTLDSIGLVGVPSNTPAGFKIKAYQDRSGANLRGRVFGREPRTSGGGAMGFRLGRVVGSSGGRRGKRSRV